MSYEFKSCEVCKKSFTKKPATKVAQWEGQRFCSPGCYWVARKDSDRYTGYWTGRKIPLEVRRRISKTLKAKPFTPRKNPKDLGYHQKHKRLTEAAGRPSECEFCGKTGETKNGRWTIEWAKKHGREYTVNVRDYLPLCHKCHHHYDNKFVG